MDRRTRPNHGRNENSITSYHTYPSCHYSSHVSEQVRKTGRKRRNEKELRNDHALDKATPTQPERRTQENSSFPRLSQDFLWDQPSISSSRMKWGSRLQVGTGETLPHHPSSLPSVYSMGARSVTLSASRPDSFLFPRLLVPVCRMQVRGKTRRSLPVLPGISQFPREVPGRAGSMRQTTR